MKFAEKPPRAKTAHFKGESMKIVKLTDKQRNAIIKTVKPSADDYNSYQNLDLLTAVYDEEKKYYLTRTRFMSAAITRTDSRGNEYSYALLTRLGCFSISCVESAGKYSVIYSPLLVIVSRGRILKLIEFYENSVFERRAIAREAAEEINAENQSFTEWYLKKHL